VPSSNAADHCWADAFHRNAFPWVGPNLGHFYLTCRD
jgi:hypothetical protein